MWGIAVSVPPPLKSKYSKTNGFGPEMFVEKRASRFEYRDSDGNTKYTLIPIPIRPCNHGNELPDFLIKYRQIYTIYKDVLK